MLTSSISAPARSMVAGTHSRSGEAVLGTAASAREISPSSASYTDGVPTRCSTPSAVLALPCGSRSMTSTRTPCRASAAARLTVLVVLPTPPFWLATVSIRRRDGRGIRCRSGCSTRAARAASSAIGVQPGCGDVSRETSDSIADTYTSPFPSPQTLHDDHRARRIDDADPARLDPGDRRRPTRRRRGRPAPPRRGRTCPSRRASSHPGGRAEGTTRRVGATERPHAT